MRGRLTLENGNAAINDMPASAVSTAQLISAHKKEGILRSRLDYCYPNVLFDGDTVKAYMSSVVSELCGK